MESGRKDSGRKESRRPHGLSPPDRPTKERPYARGRFHCQHSNPGRTKGPALAFQFATTQQMT